jgi:uncharacterized membrane protein
MSSPQAPPPPSASMPTSRPDEPEPLFPQTRGEYITVLAHYHRAEIARMAGWRDRIDRTTNWALTVAAAMMSVSLSTPSAHHGVLLFAMLLVSILLRIEARRYRFFDVYRARVRLLERNYYANILDPGPTREEGWAAKIGRDLRSPEFHLSFADARARRLRRNYVWVYLVLLLAWLLKITSAKLQPGAGSSEFAFSIQGTFENAAIGPLPGWLVIVGVAAFYGLLGYTVWRRADPEGELAYGKVHV